MSPEIGDIVFVYYNIHKECLSIQSKERIVIDYSDKAVLKDAEFRVSEAGRKRVIEEERKNVHAKIKGRWCDPDKSCEHLTEKVRYNPYLFSQFVLADSEEHIFSAPLVLVDGKEMFVSEE